MTARVRQFVIATLAVLALPILFVGVTKAQTVVQSYNTDSSLQTRLIVQLEPKDSTKVQAATQSSASKIFGVVVSPTASPVTLSGSGSANQAFVATTGNYQVLVSDQNGSIKSGDYITISALDGIGMKATNNNSIVLGKATSAFNGTGDSIGATSLKNSNGQQVTVQLGDVAVNINTGQNPLVKSQQSNLPAFLSSAGQSFSSGPVSTGKVYLGLMILLVSAIIASSLLFAGVRSSITAIGRNPLSKKSVTRSLVQVTITSLMVFIIGLFAVYLLLRF